MGEANDVLQTLQEHHDGKVGYVIYRCVYGNDAQWGQFMERLTAYVHVSLGLIKDGETLKNNFTWTVQEDAATLDGASKSEVVRQFKNWISSVNGDTTLARYRDCIMVDQEVMAAVMNGSDPSGREELFNPTAFVKIVDETYTEPPLTEVSEKNGVEDEDGGEEDYDEYPSIEGDRRFDVGWMKVSPCSLLPGLYLLLEKGGWYSLYSRPPGIADI